MINRRVFQRRVPAALSLAAQAQPRLRIPCVEVTTHPVLCGNRNFLRALRAAEMVAWEAGLPRELATPFVQALAQTTSA